MFKKVTVAAMAIGVMAAVSLPTSAFATWKHHQTAIQENLGGSLTGKARFQGNLGGVECQGIVTAEFFAGQTAGQVQNYGPHPGNETTECKGLGGIAPCQLHNWTTTVPWNFQTAAGSVLAIATGETSAQYTGGVFCLIKKTVSTPGQLIVTPNQPNTISSGQLSGTLTQDVQTNNGTVHKETIHVSGSGNLVGLDANTYSI